jgi:hypothetical protein
MTDLLFVWVLSFLVALAVGYVITSIGLRR